MRCRVLLRVEPTEVPVSGDETFASGGGSLHCPVHNSARSRESFLRLYCSQGQFGTQIAIGQTWIVSNSPQVLSMSVHEPVICWIVLVGDDLNDEFLGSRRDGEDACHSIVEVSCKVGCCGCFQRRSCEQMLRGNLDQESRH